MQKLLKTVLIAFWKYRNFSLQIYYITTVFVRILAKNFT